MLTKRRKARRLHQLNSQTKRLVEQGADHLIAAYRVFDEEWVNHFRKRQKKIACRNGCDTCCHPYFELSAVEFMFILQEIEKLSGGAERWVRKKMRQCLSNFVEDIGLMSSNLEVFDRVDLCPFLYKQSCTIYDVRPRNCRTSFCYEEKDAIYEPILLSNWLKETIRKIPVNISQEHLKIFDAEEALCLWLNVYQEGGFSQITV